MRNSRTLLTSPLRQAKPNLPQTANRRLYEPIDFGYFDLGHIVLDLRFWIGKERKQVNEVLYEAR